MPDIVLVGAGNVASHLAPPLAAQRRLAAVASTDGRSAANLCATLPGVEACTLDSLPEVPVYLLAVSDDAIEQVVRSIPDNGALWVHTSGSTPLAALSHHRKHAAVAYPLQSFTKGVPVSLREVPFLVEATDTESLQRAKELAACLSDIVIQADGDTRARIHLAAVVAANLTTRLWGIAEELLTAKGLTLSVLHHLMRESLEKSISKGPEAALTGPAKRGDTAVVARQLASLEAIDHQYAEIYRIISDNIMSHEQNRL